jgi:hypothetical protein
MFNGEHIPIWLRLCSVLCNMFDQSVLDHRVLESLRYDGKELWQLFEQSHCKDGQQPHL